MEDLLLPWRREDDPDEEEDDICGAEEVVVVVVVVVSWLTVDNCSWMSIMWSPRRMVRFNGAAPDRKSFT